MCVSLSTRNCASYRSDLETCVLKSRETARIRSSARPSQSLETRLEPLSKPNRRIPNRGLSLDAAVGGFRFARARREHLPPNDSAANLRFFSRGVSSSRDRVRFGRLTSVLKSHGHALHRSNTSSSPSIPTRVSNLDENPNFNSKTRPVVGRRRRARAVSAESEPTRTSFKIVTKVESRCRSTSSSTCTPGSPGA